MARIREMIQLRECEVEWINKDEQLADPLTKAGASPNKLLEVLDWEAVRAPSIHSVNSV